MSEKRKKTLTYLAWRAILGHIPIPLLEEIMAPPVLHWPAPFLLSEVLMVEHAPARILVVDNEATVRMSLEALLRRHGHSVETATNGPEALAWVLQCRFDLLLIDLKTPGIDGVEVARCTQRCQPSAAILFLTGSSDFNGNAIEQQIGHFDYVRKAAGPDEVMDRVTTAVIS